MNVNVVAKSASLRPLLMSGTVYKTVSRYRPIAPRPQEGVPPPHHLGKQAQAGPPPQQQQQHRAGAKKRKDVPGGAASNKKQQGGSMKAPTHKGAASKGANAKKAKGGDGKAGGRHAPKDPLHSVGPFVDGGEISLDPKDFCYADLKSMQSEFDTAGAGAGAGFFQPVGFQPVDCAPSLPPTSSAGTTIQFVGKHAANPPPMGVFDQGRRGNAGCTSSLPWPSQPASPSLGFVGGGRPSLPPLPSPMMSSFPFGNNLPDQSCGGGFNLNAPQLSAGGTTMKLDLDEDSVAKAMASSEDGTEGKVYTTPAAAAAAAARESGASAGTDEASEPSNSGCAELPFPKTHNNTRANIAGGSGSGSECEVKGLGRPEAANRSRTRIQDDPTLLTHTHTPAHANGNANATTANNNGFPYMSFGSCIAKGSTNPLFQMERRLACSFIAEFLDDEDFLNAASEPTHVKGTIDCLKREAASKLLPAKAQQEQQQQGVGGVAAVAAAANANPAAANRAAQQPGQQREIQAPAAAPVVKVEAA